MERLFMGLPFGFSSFDKVRDMLIPCRAISRIPENAKTVISVLFPYYLGEEYYKKANVSRYAVSEDYHIITGDIINCITESLRQKYPENVFEAFIDNSPLPEVRCAVNAGLGVMGVNNLFINKDYGSWVFLGEIVTDRVFPFYEGEYSLCDGCNMCKTSCPAGAITGKGIIKEKCLSFLSQKKGELSEDTKEKIAATGCAWGCDICQKVCPLNKNAKITPIKEFFETAAPYVTKDTDIENRAFSWRGKAVIDRNLDIIG
ncbi:MAG: DUF1730 domain-containing protein [Ruminococcaceae bacterium]|nr:DUF1730 domain-containing protein [Oscillospiraceae bacterium]